MSAELAGLGAGQGPHSPGADCRLCPAVAGCVFPRTPEARPQCRARGAEEGCERRGELRRLAGGPRTQILTTNTVVLCFVCYFVCCADFLSQGRLSLLIARTVNYRPGCWGLGLCPLTRVLHAGSVFEFPRVA